MKKNIYLAYLLTFCRHSWFWLGIWIFYYLKFTNYAGIGVLETIMIISMTLTEVPTGAIADLIGKSKTLFFSFLFQGVGAVLMAKAGNFSWLILSIFLLTFGGSLYSGTLEALIFDSLKQEKKVFLYDRIIATVSSIHLVTIAVCGAIGGWLYTQSPALPFLANGGLNFLGMLITLFLIEPKIDTEKFSLKNYFNQIKQGWRQLTQTVAIKNQTLLLLSIGVIMVITDEMLNSFLGVEFGFSEQSIGIFFAVVFLVAAFASQLTPLIKTKFGPQTALIMVSVGLALTLLFSPLLGLIFGALSILIRISLQYIYANLSSMLINQHTASKYRATTLSTFNMLKNIPYVLSAYVFGVLADQLTAKISAFVLGIILIVLIGFLISKKILKFSNNQIN